MHGLGPWLHMLSRIAARGSVAWVLVRASTGTGTLVAVRDVRLGWMGGPSLPIAMQAMHRLSQIRRAPTPEHVRTARPSLLTIVAVALVKRFFSPLLLSRGSTETYRRWWSWRRARGYGTEVGGTRDTTTAAATTTTSGRPD